MNHHAHGYHFTATCACGCRLTICVEPTPEHYTTGHTASLEAVPGAQVSKEEVLKRFVANHEAVQGISPEVLALLLALLTDPKFIALIQRLFGG